ncbi:MAG: flagellin [Fibrobacterota bacterium]
MNISKLPSSAFVKITQKRSRKLSGIFEKLSTGLRINRASDDAAGLGVSEALRSQIRGFGAARNNTAMASSSLNISEGTGNEVHSMLQRQRELAIQASNGTMNQQQRDALNTEYQNLNEEITRIAETSNFNGQPNADGSAPLADGSGRVAVGANGESVNLEGADFTADALGITGTDISSSAGAAAAVGAIDSAISSVSSGRTSQGAQINMLEHTYNNLLTSEARTQEAESAIRDLDFAEGVAEQTRQSILQQTNIQAMKNFRNISRNNMLKLLGGS